jgi:hypothetical protein
MIDGLTSASSLSNLSCWLPNISLKAQALKLENPVFRIHHSGPFILCCNAPYLLANTRANASDVGGGIMTSIDGLDGHQSVEGT